MPFLSPRDSGLVLDRVGFEPGQTPNPPIMDRLAESLDLSEVGQLFPAEIAAEIIEEQYEVCLDHVYADPIWQDFREGRGRAALLAYLLETRHYLHAAASRMSPGVAAGWHDGPAEMVLAEHVSEEADHAIFPEEALEVLECDTHKVQECRPSPITLEWIYLMRSVAARGPLISAVCSGLLEFSAMDKPLVLDWHQMIVANGLLPAPAATAIRKHVELDMELGHGANWREVVHNESPLTSRQLRDCLNSVSTVAEMLVRWCSMLRLGLAGDIVSVLPEIEIDRRAAAAVKLDPIFNGLPVWPARILHEVCYGADSPAGTRTILALAYFLDDRMQRSDSEIGQLSRRVLDTAEARSEAKRPEDVKALLDSWLRSIDGHSLWEEMVEHPTVPLIYGWLLENYFYLGAASGHVSAAIASCPDPIIRRVLVKHLEEERDHARVLRVGLDAVRVPISPDRSRPLATTVGFLGFLREVGAQDWKAYCLAITFLQATLSPGEPRHAEFYRRIISKCPDAEPLMRAMQRHDSIDEDMGHHGDADELLSLLCSRHSIDQSTIARAAVLPQLAWSFLDGIRAHYRNGEPSIAQRIAWSTH